MASIFTTGPVDIWVGLGGGQLSQSPIFLGHGVKAPKPQEEHNWRPIFCDLGGDMEAFDWLWQRGHLLFTVDLIRVNMAVLLALRSRPNPFTGTLGQNVVGDVGTLMVTEGLTFPVWMRWPYSLKGAMAGLPNGIHGYYAFFMGPDEHTTGAGDAYKLRAKFFLINVYQANTGGFLCYDGNMTGLGTIN